LFFFAFSYSKRQMEKLKKVKFMQAKKKEGKRRKFNSMTIKVRTLMM
jgi:hypothetical protein